MAKRTNTVSIPSGTRWNDLRHTFATSKNFATFVMGRLKIEKLPNNEYQVWTLAGDYVSTFSMDVDGLAYFVLANHE